MQHLDRQTKLNLVAIATAATATTIAAATTTAAAVDLGTRFVDVQRTSANLSAVQRGDGFVAFFRVAHFHEAETARSAGVPVGHNADSVDLSVCLEKLAQFVF